MLRRLAIALLVLLTCASPAAAGPFEDGFAAYQRGDYATARVHWLPLAQQGNAEAQFFLGFMYTEGKGAPQNYGQAVYWYRRAAEQGNGPAQASVGAMYETGEGVPQNYGLAVYWYRRAAEQGLAMAQGNLGLMYGKGLGVPQDAVQAHMWFNLAAARETDPQRRSTMMNNRDVIAAKMTREQIAEAQRLAREWKPKTN